MESIKHFSHPRHSLILKKLGEKEEVKCYGCQEAITDEEDNYYACEEEEEEEEEEECHSFYLHKKCADLPAEINLPIHIHIHPLTLLDHRYFSCDFCDRSFQNGFCYRCSVCDFDIDVICSSLLQEGNKILQHEAHPHPLALHITPSLFHCDACNTDDIKDLSYFCTTCQFWIHKSCASAPKSITVAHHDDPLFLAYSLPPQHHNFHQFCDICSKRVYPSNWVYYCDDCRYFNHLKCATSNTPMLTTTGETEIQPQEGDSELMLFPFSNPESLDSLSLFVAANKIASGAYDNGGTEIFHHRFHDHPLSIHTNEADIPTNNQQAYNEILCDGCVRPISVPFYSCSICNFFLHRFCAELPTELQCPRDSGHSIKVMKYANYNDYFECSFCLRVCTGFLCECVSCKLDLDIGCASNLIPSRIKHNSHRQHPLVRSRLPTKERNIKCNACGYGTGGSHTFSCEACSYNLCISCVNNPGSVRHEYDRHSIPLTYPPVKDHPSDFICEICEEDINPRYWMYHCQDCNQSFHTHCLSPTDWYSNVKFGGTVSIENIHQHALAFVRNSRSENASLCDRCGQDVNEIPILECAPCGFKLCLACARQLSERERERRKFKYYRRQAAITENDN